MGEEMVQLELALSEVETNQLHDCEATIERGLETFIEVGIAFTVINDGRLYRATHKTFDDYCRERWKMSRPRAYQLMGAAKVAQNLSTTVDNSPTNESQVRPLTGLEPEDQRTVWSQAVDESGGEVPTAAKVEDVVKTLTQAVAAQRKKRKRKSASKPKPKSEPEAAPEPIMSKAELAKLREEMRVNGTHVSQVWGFIRAIETLSNSSLPLA